ncbi:hypothetical protein J2X45_003358 [Caulobacter sp. BE264]|uniref:hypothetical protein n=1 Tax=Caulobacter sp. BE264 TaxID=2817724 RepID=UPI0028565FC8|nr:hypothetical protein [Caulobacter sp. BE264]MDR7232252.1 hypothetical protein [Caulobacter sp. BE264]
MGDAVSRFIVAKFGHEIRHDEPLEFTVDEFRQAARLAALAGDEERIALRAALEAIKDLSPAEINHRARIIARDALKAFA